jgi:anti-anti-sigma regulatory factor
VDASRIGVGVRLEDELLLPVFGVLDGGLAPALHAALMEATEFGSRYLVVDLSAVVAIDEGGRAVLAAAANHLAALDGMLMLALPDRDPAPIADASALRALFG